MWQKTYSDHGRAVAKERLCEKCPVSKIKSRTNKCSCKSGILLSKSSGKRRKSFVQDPDRVPCAFRLLVPAPRRQPPRTPLPRADAVGIYFLAEVEQLPELQPALIDRIRDPPAQALVEHDVLGFLE